jgi:hypothetical protein
MVLNTTRTRLALFRGDTDDGRGQLPLKYPVYLFDCSLQNRTHRLIHVVPRTDIVVSGRRQNNLRTPWHVRNRRRLSICFDRQGSVAAGCGGEEGRFECSCVSCEACWARGNTHVCLEAATGAGRADVPNLIACPPRPVPRSFVVAFSPSSMVPLSFSQKSKSPGR